MDRPESPTDPKAKFLLTNLELQNEQDCPVLELVEVPKVPISISLFSFFLLHSGYLLVFLYSVYISKLSMITFLNWRHEESPTVESPRKWGLEWS